MCNLALDALLPTHKLAHAHLCASAAVAVGAAAAVRALSKKRIALASGDAA